MIYADISRPPMDICQSHAVPSSCAGKDLYLIPGIDMLNHRTKPEEVNSSLQQHEKKVVERFTDSVEAVKFRGFFAINAGVAPHGHH